LCTQLIRLTREALVREADLIHLATEVAEREERGGTKGVTFAIIYPTTPTNRRMDMARTGLTFPGGVCIWVGCSNSFEGELPPDWLWLITYWSPEPTLGMSLDDEEIGNIPTRHGALCGEHARELEVILKPSR
jgi:hypothetical protein